MSEELRSFANLTEDLFQTTLLGVVYQSATGEILAANPAAQEILGLTLDEMTGRTSLDPRWQAIHETGAIFRVTLIRRRSLSGPAGVSGM